MRWCSSAVHRAPRFASLVAVSALGLAVACSGGSSSGGGLSDTTNDPDLPRTDLPDAVVDLDDEFDIELATSASMPVKMAAAADGRIFYNELDSGQTRILLADGTDQATPFATEPDLVTGNERGLLGLALSPNFSVDGHVFILACVSGPDRMRVVRYEDSSGTGINRTVIIDNLPVANVHNAGDLEFLPDGTLLVSTGDVQNIALAQTDGELAGRILRYNADGSIPADNPDPTDPEWCRGFRNPFDLEVHPDSGEVFVSENGPAENDEINLARPGKNFEWGGLPMGFPQADVGSRLRLYPDVIAPTGMAVNTHPGQPAGYTNSLYLASYSFTEVRRFPLSGPFSVDFDDELVFLVFEDDSTSNLPLDVEVGPDGTIYVATFTGIWAVTPK